MCVLVALHDDVIDVSDQIFPLLLIEYFIGHSRKYWAYVVLPLKHPPVTVRASVGDEACFFFVFGVQ